MANLKQVKQRIKTSKNIQQITRAMKLVSAARLKKAQDRALDARAYSDHMRHLMLSVSGAFDLPYHPMIEKRKTPREMERYGLLLISSERGLAGSYNSALMKEAAQFMNGKPGQPKLFCVGKKGAQFFGKRGYDVVFEHSLASSGAKLEDARKIAETIKDSYLSKEVDGIYICYSKFYSAIRQVPEVSQLIPIVAPEILQGKTDDREFIFEPDPTHLLDILLPRYLLTLLYQALLESIASEHAARMTAMTSATDNAQKMISNLTLIANRERQAGITKEILEVVAGAEAL